MRFKKLTGNLVLFICFVALSSLFGRSQSNQLKVLAETKKEVSCKEAPHFNNLEIRTNYNPNSEVFNVPIFSNCTVQNMWISRENQYSQCTIIERVFEGEDNIRRAIRFTNRNAPNSKTININNIKLSFNKLIADSGISETKMTLHPGEARDIYIDYECTDKDPLKRLKIPWYNLKIEVELEEGKMIQFEMIKICEASYTGSLDFSHLAIIIVSMGVIYLASQDYLKSDYESTFLEKYHEMRNPENLTLLSLLVCLFFMFLGVSGYFPNFAHYVCILTGVFSIALIVQALCIKFGILVYFESATYEIPYIGSISILFLISCVVGLFIEYCYITWKHWFFSDIIAISMAIIIIRFLRFTSFKWIISIYFISYIYTYLWTKNKSNYYGEDFKLSNFSPISLPVKVIFPEFTSSPFGACSYIGIADLILPGLLLTYNKTFDNNHNGNDIYLNSGYIGSFIGLLINVIIYYSKSLPTPCFLYSGPLLLIISISVALSRNEHKLYINGFPSSIFESKKNTMSILAERKDDYQPPSVGAKENSKGEKMQELKNIEEDDTYEQRELGVKKRKKKSFTDNN